MSILNTLTLAESLLLHNLHSAKVMARESKLKPVSVTAYVEFTPANKAMLESLQSKHLLDWHKVAGRCSAWTTDLADMLIDGTFDSMTDLQKVELVLDGIDEDSSSGGWFETSGGVSFGASVLGQIRYILGGK